jgi:hypothetical protein
MQLRSYVEPCWRRLSEQTLSARPHPVVLDTRCMLKLLLDHPLNNRYTHSLEPLRRVTLHHYYNENRGTEYCLDQNMLQETSRPASSEGMSVRMKERLAEVQTEEILILKRQWCVAKLRLG